MLRVILTAVLRIRFTPAAFLVLHTSRQAVALCFLYAPSGPRESRWASPGPPAVLAAPIIRNLTPQMKTMTDCGIRDMMKRMGL